jgi:hypothetical protein
MKSLNELQKLATKISVKRNEKPYSKFVALRKIFVQEKRQWPAGIQTGWKRGEIFEVFEALLKLDFQDFKKEWGDIGYYVASSYGVLKALYCLVTPKSVIEAAEKKFTERAGL